MVTEQRLPALAVRADVLQRLHDRARAAMVAAKELGLQDQALCDSLQDLHLEIGSPLVELQDAAESQGIPLPAERRVESSEFLTFDR